ncbi:uncharacterized protein LOC123260791 isoform X1 [Cotesia glomerata]|uniref:uncharacterized protein LOC123260791 isoform X1 n=1 Tax=Cotesia glomerata TaxID=32391 RepID=UPI001D0261B1|nr:uncharacterized protein LOC123260791 isoform X1 [Cotesia glomerata]
MRPIDFIVFLLFFVWSVTSQEVSNNGSQKYDPNSLEMNKKLMKTFLRLFYQAANRVMALKNKPSNHIDADVQNISISDILKSQNSDIQSRFFFPSESRGFFDNLNPVNAISIMSKSATGGVVDPKDLAPNLGQTLIEIGNKALDGMNSTVRIVSDSAGALGGHSTESGARIEEAGKESNVSTPFLRFMGDLDNSTSTNVTNASSNSTNSTDKAEARVNLNPDPVSSTVEPGNATKAPEITKREASVLTLNNPSNNLNGKFPSSKITDPASVDKGVAAEPVRVIRSPSSDENDDIFDFPEDNDIKDVQPIISNMKLGEIVDKFSYL